jgi:hypothetical protein
MGSYYHDPQTSSAEKAEAQLLATEWREGHESIVCELCNKKPGLLPQLLDLLDAQEGQRLLQVWMKASLGTLPSEKMW